MMFRWGLLILGLALLIACSPQEGEHEVSETPETEVQPEPDPEPEVVSAFTITGMVVNDDDEPVAEASVLQGGKPDFMVLTDENGRFTLDMVNPGYGNITAVATKDGFRAVGQEFMSPWMDITLKIREIKGPDNEEYIFQDPGDGIDFMKEDCTHCHTTFVYDFLQSKHAEAAKNPLLHDLYNGVSRKWATQADCETAGGRWLQGKEPGTDSTLMMRCYIHGGVLADLNDGCGGEGQLTCDDPGLSAEETPTDFGACADCHAPGIDGVLGDRNLNEAVGLAYEKGVHCDVCHKVADIDLSKPPGVGKRLVMGRPSEPGRNVYQWDPVFYGPIRDVPNVLMGGSYQPKFNQAVFCAGCHEQNQEALIPGDVLDAAKFPDGLPVHSTYSEWLAGPFNNEATPCQFCHMPEISDMFNAVDLSAPEKASVTFGYERAPSDIRRHSFRGPLEGNPRLIDQSLYVSVKLDKGDGSISASVSVANVGCGHAIPTGEPMRSLVMVIDAEGDGCGELSAMDGMTIPATGGHYLKAVVGESLSVEGATFTLDTRGLLPGMVVRAVRPSGEFDDYNGIGYFASPDLGAQAKGMEIFQPVGQASILSVEQTIVTLDEALELEAGDVVYVGDTWTSDEEDGDASKHLAGRPGYAFAKVLADSAGNQEVPHYKAVDIVRDNRIAPGTNSLTQHVFELPEGCSTGEVRATVMYRPRPLSQSELWGWDAKDYIIASGVARYGDAPEQ